LIDQIMAADFFVAPAVTYRLLSTLVILAHERRGNAHVGPPKTGPRPRGQRRRPQPRPVTTSWSADFRVFLSDGHSEINVA
jgi:hypothetical protein